jgi:hypothetical protein
MYNTIISGADERGRKNQTGGVSGRGTLNAGRGWHWTRICLLASTVVARAWGQDPFQDLDFQSGAIVRMNSDDPSEISACSALPGWTVYYGKTHETTIGYNLASIGQANVSLLSSGWRDGAPPGFARGGYYLLLQEGSYGSSQPGDEPSWETVSLAQTAQIPATAMSMTFRASVAQLTVFLDGTVLPVEVLDSGRGYDTYECDVSQFAGETAQLEFTAGDPTVYLDDIRFSPVPVPEPLAARVFLAGGALLLWRRAFRPRETRSSLIPEMGKTPHGERMSPRAILLPAVNTHHNRKPRTFGEFIAGVYDTCGSQMAAGLVRLAIEAHWIEFRVRERAVVAERSNIIVRLHE